MSPLSAQQNNTEGTLIPWGWRHSVEKSSAFVRLTLMHREEVSPPIRLGGLGERHEQILHLSSWKMGVRYSQSKKWYTGTPRTPVNYALWLRTPLVRFSWANSKTSYVFPFYASSFIFSYHQSIMPQSLHAFSSLSFCSVSSTSNIAYLLTRLPVSSPVFFMCERQIISCYWLILACCRWSVLKCKMTSRTASWISSSCSSDTKLVVVTVTSPSFTAQSINQSINQSISQLITHWTCARKLTVNQLGLPHRDRPLWLAY